MLPDYGTGAVMAVPAHDVRDFAFARQEGLPVRLVYHVEDQDVDPSTLTEAILHQGVDPQRDRPSTVWRTARRRSSKFIAWLEEKGWGRGKVTYRLRDWLISRQRYWGTPIPVVYCDKCGLVPVPEDQLPVELPYDVEFTGREGNPLSRSKAFVETTCPKCGGPARRETDTMDTFVDSSWYYLRYLSPRDSTRMFDPELANRWMPVDQYIGGIEHAILHLLYARFICRVLHDFGLVELRGAVPEPVQPGDDHALLGEVGPHREDVEVAGQHGLARRADRARWEPTPSGSTPSSSVRRRRRPSGATRPFRAPTASSSGSGACSSGCPTRRPRRRPTPSWSATATPPSSG